MKKTPLHFKGTAISWPRTVVAAHDSPWLRGRWTSVPAESQTDGIRVNQQENLYASGPGGFRILSPEGKHLGTLHGPEYLYNQAWGGADHRILYLASQTGIYRLV